MEGYKPLGREIMDDDRRWFYKKQKKYGKFTVMAWILSPEPQKKNLPVPTITISGKNSRFQFLIEQKIK